MSTKIYWFSATGNSLTTAKLLADGLEDCALAPVAATRGQDKIIEDADCVGFVFPVYYGNMPWPVREAISKMVFRPDTYVFIVTTQRGHAGAVAKRMDQLLRTRGVKLSLAQGVMMPGNSFINPPEKDAEYLAAQKDSVAALVAPIRERRAESYFTDEVLPMTPIDYPNNFRGIMSDEWDCFGCGTCVRVCPMGNIRLEGGQAVIGDNCATCLACFHWCPVQAIWMSKQEGIERRAKYKHPDVKMQDIVDQKG